MWTAAARAQYGAEHGTYPSSVSDAEWAVIEPHLPSPRADASRGLLRGKDMAWPMRRIVDAIFYVLRNGAPWRALPSDFPPWETVYYWFRRFAHKALFERLNHVLVILDREQAGRQASPSAAIVDSQTVKATEAPAPRAFDGGKKIVGLKRHALVDVEGRILLVGFSKADLHDSRGGAALVKASQRQWPFIELVWADQAYRGRRMEAAAAPAKVEIISGLVGQRGFVVQPRRWVVERSFAWFNRSRRLWRVCEAVLETISAMTYAASVFMLMRRIAKRRIC
ncbi:MAG TPA: IS5 family transposase [Candidatus Solibacter sp.]|jgi:transposase|nr:IS5 family transposase [Candidatus Solibacter sp.]